MIGSWRLFSKPITWIVATAIMAILLWLAISGIRPTVWLQMTFVVVEYGAVISFVILALIHEASHAGGATLPSWSNFTPSGTVGGVGGIKGLAEAAVVCGFLYLGWEATAVLGEESTNISASGMLGLFMYFVIALSSVWFYRSELRRGLGTAVVRGVLPLLGGLFMGVIFFYGLTTQAPAVAWVSVAGVALVYVLGIIVRAVAPRMARGEDRGRAEDSITEPG